MNTKNYDFSENALATLRESVKSDLSEYRYAHIAAVERMIERLGALYLSDEIPMLRAAALLHDLTKEFSKEKHEKILSSHGIIVTDEMRLSPKLYHAVTASLLIPELYPQFSHPTLLSAVRYHTTGYTDATTFDLLLYLADYIDDSRTFDDCVLLREYFWGKHPERMDATGRRRHLWDTVIRSVDLTAASLIEEGSPISADSIHMRNRLILLSKNT
ncbi:MAG: HD domain-containing protein [Clostridia bacterium]|nr:HD domain-containing protein [Clostridia bacterium]